MNNKMRYSKMKLYFVPEDLEFVSSGLTKSVYKDSLKSSGFKAWKKSHTMSKFCRLLNFTLRHAFTEILQCRDEDILYVNYLKGRCITFLRRLEKRVKRKKQTEAARDLWYIRNKETVFNRLRRSRKYSAFTEHYNH